MSDDVSPAAEHKTLGHVAWTNWLIRASSVPGIDADKAWNQLSPGTRLCWDEIAKAISDHELKEWRHAHLRLCAIVDEYRDSLAKERETSKKAIELLRGLLVNGLLHETMARRRDGARDFISSYESTRKQP